MLPFIFIMPLLQTLILVYAATFEMQNIVLKIADYDNTYSSRELKRKFEASPFYKLSHAALTAEAHEDILTQGAADAVMVIPEGFESDIKRGEATEVQLLLDAVNQQSAGLINAYTGQIVQDFNTELVQEQGLHLVSSSIKQLDISIRYWYNSQLNYKHYMLPGILVILVTIIGGFLTALNLVREKEMGTIEQINVTPIRKGQFLFGKLLPFLLIALFDLGLGLLIGVLLFDLPIVGSLLTLFVFSLIYLITAIALGILISNEARNQQQVMFSIFFFFVIFILMSGIFTPIESMPGWAQIVNYINPLYYFMKAIRMILLKGSDLMDVRNELFALFAYGCTLFTIAVLRYRKTSN